MYYPKPKPSQFNRFILKSPKGKYDVTPGDESCSTRISQKLDTEGDVENSCSTRISKSGDQDCSTRISSNAGGTSAVEGRNLSLIRVEQNGCRNLLITEPDYLSEEDGQLTIFSDDEPPEPDDFNSLGEFEQAWAKWELQYPELAEAVRQSERETQTIRVEQQSLTIPVEQTSEGFGGKLKKSRNTKPGRGSRPKQVNCNLKRNGSQGKNPNTYWVYKFSFKVDGKYYNRSVSIPKEEVEQVISMWESKQYSWRDIVEFIGNNPDKIINKLRGK